MIGSQGLLNSVTNKNEIEYYLHLPVSHVSPVKSSVQLHVNMLIPSVQLPSLRQGLGSQSSMFISQISPPYPSSQSQVNESIPSVQFP